MVAAFSSEDGVPSSTRSKLKEIAERAEQRLRASGQWEVELASRKALARHRAYGSGNDRSSD